MYQDHTPDPPDGPTPAREQLPLPRRRRQAHLEPRLREPEDNGPGGTSFAAFAADGAAEPTRNAPAERADGSERAHRAAAFHAGARRGRGATGPGRLGSDRDKSDH